MSKKQKKMICRILIAAALFAVAFAVNRLLSPAWWTAVLIMTIPYLFIGWDVLKEAVEKLFGGQVFDEDLLMTVASLGALLLCVVEQDAHEAHEAVAIMLLFRVGELFENVAIGRSRKSVSSLLDMMPEFANVERDGAHVKVSPEEVAIGESIIVFPGERIPLDGMIVEGRSELNTASLTGESLPRAVEVGDSVVAGCINLSGSLKVKVSKSFSESTVSKIMELVESAGANKAKSENFISSFARIYTPTVTGIAALIAILPPVFIGITSGNWGFSGTWYRFVRAALMFLIVSCPCALVISVPMAFFGGIGGASAKGILIKGSAFVESLAKTKIAVFDKTGTLTEGNFSVRSVVAVNGREEELLALAASAEEYSTHPLGVAIRNAAKGLTLPTNEQSTELPGRGLCACINGEEIYAGNLRLMADQGARALETPEEGSAIHLSRGSEYLGYILLEDQIKEDACDAVSALKNAGVKTVMLTGDRKVVAENVAKEIGMDDFRAELLPEDKVQLAEQLMEEKAQRTTLLFVGDGINDAPVLARADVGVAMGALGSDAAIEAADVVLMNDKPSDVYKAIAIARKTVRIVHQNIIFALTVKFAVMILLALTAVFPALSGLSAYAGTFAIFADVGVSIIAILNAMRAMK